MLDLRVLRDNFRTVADALKKRGKQIELDAVMKLDEERRAMMTKVEELKAKRNRISKEIPVMKKKGEDVSDIMMEMKVLASQIKDYDAELQIMSAHLNQLMMTIPNRPDASVPAGTDDSDNKEIRKFLEPTKFDFKPKAHWDLGHDLGILDPEIGAKVAGSRFVFYKGLGARLERAVMNFMLNVHTEQNGYTEVIPPFVANQKSMEGTGQLPKFAEDMYHIEDTDLYLIPTAEVPVTNMYRESVIDGEELPIYRCAYTPCFRAEAGSAGRDTKGLIRLHQFNKVELVKFTRPEESYLELEKLVANAESILQILQIPYRVVLLCGGDLGFSSAKTYDIEVWMPSYGRYVEISSCSNFEDFQARRANIRFRDNDGSLKYVHTLNGSGLAVGRTVAAIMENYQQADGSIKVPQALQPYMGREVIRGIK
ncbi:serine--tRNA ligase [Christensenella tenuis]|jgi:seryl-tRNA synthetase|uniref:Serine--tRNA ligase n=1 Tax=Christensenella tenuis TaxID=2763033 RepID=A0ABR7EER2_9FIRM|nr:serine--tRNA ligase [Christensenella tenuis]MBC5648280.1 serine--tRNA ligase [Christensenella tenuis]